jgi:hypothetical protein
MIFRRRSFFGRDKVGIGFEGKPRELFSFESAAGFDERMHRKVKADQSE